MLGEIIITSSDFVCRCEVQGGEGCQRQLVGSLFRQEGAAKIMNFTITLVCRLNEFGMFSLSDAGVVIQ
jgi:hypothetical protein